MAEKKSKKKRAKRNIAKKKPANEAKSQNEVVKKDDPGEEFLQMLTDSEGNTREIKRRHITGLNAGSFPIVGRDKLLKLDHFQLMLDAMGAALRLRRKDLEDEVFDKILAEILVGAYQDRFIVYVLTATDENSAEAFRKVQANRHAADNHLLTILKAIKDIRRPPVNVVVKNADQVNVAEQINQGQEQVNIGKHQQPNINTDKRPT